MISLFQLQFDSPVENLAADEALLEICDASEHGGFLRFWESRVHFAVLGYGKNLERELYREECARAEIPILRRCSGGGTVLQGPGCFNYSLVLPFSLAPELETITGANRYIMQRVAGIVAEVSQRRIEIRGVTDLVHEGRKLSGNAQRRKKRCLLFHGCFLIDFDLSLISRTLRSPEQQPEYRAGRAHADFVANVPLDRATLREVFVAEWGARAGGAEENARALTADLVRTRYSKQDWNERPAF